MPLVGNVGLLAAVRCFSPPPLNFALILGGLRIPIELLLPLLLSLSLLLVGDAGLLAASWGLRPPQLCLHV